MKIGIQPLLPIGNYLNKRYCIEMDFPDDSHPADNFKYLHETVMAIHMMEYPVLYKDGNPLYSQFSAYQGEEQPAKKVEPQTKETIEQSTIKAIQGCTDLKVLKTFEKLAKNYPLVQAEYNSILTKLMLSQNQIKH